MFANPIDSSKPDKAYAKAQVKEVMSFRDFVSHIAEHGGYKRGQVKGVLSDMCSCLVEQLLEGKKVMLDELGNFWLSLSSEGAESCEAFNAKNITGVNIIFTPGEDFENLLSVPHLILCQAARCRTLLSRQRRRARRPSTLRL